LGAIAERAGRGFSFARGGLAKLGGWGI